MSIYYVQNRNNYNILGEYRFVSLPRHGFGFLTVFWMSSTIFWRYPGQQTYMNKKLDTMRLLHETSTDYFLKI